MNPSTMLSLMFVIAALVVLGADPVILTAGLTAGAALTLWANRRK